MTFKRALTRWFVFARLGKADTTRDFYRETVKAIRRECRHTLNTPTAAITEETVLLIGNRLAHFSPSRWNAFVQCLRFVTPNARVLKRRPLKLTRLPPPNQIQFAALLAECDKLPRSRAGLVIDFLAHTGLRITAARRVRWLDVHEDRIEYIAKGGRRCAVPILPGLRSVLDRLKPITGMTDFVLPPEGIRTGLVKACRRAGIRPLTHHDFRHMFATRCIESGTPLPIVARWLGHKDGGALLSKRYFHLMDSHSRELAQRVSILPVTQPTPVAPSVPVLIASLPSLNFQIVSA